MRRDSIFFLRHDPHLASSTAAIIGHRTHVSGTRSMPTAHRGKGVGPASLSRGGRGASGASASRTRRSSRLHGGDDVVASERSVDEDTMEEVSAGNALLALSCRSRPTETGPATLASPEPSTGAAPPRPRRRSAPPPGRWSPASQKNAPNINETKTSKPGGGALKSFSITTLVIILAHCWCNSTRKAVAIAFITGIVAMVKPRLSSSELPLLGCLVASKSKAGFPY